MINDVFEMNTDNGKSRETYMLLDISNHMHRNRHGALKADDIAEYALYLGIAGMQKLYRELKPTKIVAAMDYGSWRKEIFPMYKSIRHNDHKDDPTYPKFLETVKEFKNILKEHTSIICLEHKMIEADDWIGRWVQTHPMDNHIIVSSDGDFHQLHADNVTQYNPVAKAWVKVDDPKFALFLKCIRGETAKTSDNIPSAYPKIRTDKLETAFYNDKFVMENIMQHMIPDIADKDENGEPRMKTVKYLYERNKHLMDLSDQPQDIIDTMDSIIADASKNVGNFDMFQVLRFLGKNNLIKIANNIETYVPMFQL